VVLDDKASTPVYEVGDKTFALKQAIKSNSFADGYKEFPLKEELIVAPGITTLGYLFN